VAATHARQLHTANENPLSILDHSKWPEILPHLYVQQGGGLNGPRHRIEAREGAALFMDVQTPCVGCGRPHYPITRRARWGTIYFSVTCARSMPCRNGRAARIEADAIRAAIHGQPSARMLFPDA
jgi:hypothetical protein